MRNTCMLPAGTESRRGGKLSRSLGRARAAAALCASRILPGALGKAALRRAFARNLVSLRGLPLKMSQVLSMSSDPAVAEAHRQALAELPPMPLETVRAILRAEAPALAAGLRRISPRGLPASLGQVHRALLEDGRTCAVKIRYPGISPEVDLDRGWMDMMLSAFGHFRRGFDIGEYRALIGAELRAELDYPSEAERQQRLAGVFPAGGGVVVPRPYPAESGRNHILMDWEPSRPLERHAASLRRRGARDAEAGFAAAGLVAEFHLGCLFGAGRVHADPNPGNFGFRSFRGRPQLVVYDYGSVMELPPGIRRGLPRLFRTVRSGGGDVFPLLRDMGFQEAPLEPIRDRLGALCAILLEPFLEGDAYDLGRWRRKERVQDLLGAERWNFMLAAPPALFPLMRAFHGLFHYAALLGGKGPFGAVLAAHLRREESRPESPVGVTPGESPGTGGARAATRLRIEVRRGGGRSVSLTMPGESAGRLESLIEPGLLERIRKRGFDPGACAEKARREGFPPGVLFRWTDGEIGTDVWLE